LNLSLHEGFRVAAMPLFQEGLVDAIEWTIDHECGGGFSAHKTPDWAQRLLDAYAEEDSLYGHGVWFSAFSADWQARQDRWLEHVHAEAQRRPYRHVTEHFGYFSAGPIGRNTMLPLPRCDASIAVGIDRIRRISEAVGTTIGLENSAVALSAADCVDQGAFLDDVLGPTDSFLLLDVHNIYTQAYNFGLSAEALLDSYPLDRVTEIHISGGSMAPTRAGAPVRLDGHDGPVPQGVYPLLARALARCPNVEVVFLERRDHTLPDGDACAHFRTEFRNLVQFLAELP
jgi:uncharacterized protein (UPF0276 family)